MKLQTEAHLRQAGRTWGEVKLGEGSIRDAEFVVQYLQLAHGGHYEELRTGNTMQAMTRLAERGLLTPGEHRILAEGYTFLRTVEHYLQILEYRQTHTLPENPADLRYLARRLGFDGPERRPRSLSSATSSTRPPCAPSTCATSPVRPSRSNQASSSRHGERVHRENLVLSGYRRHSNDAG